VTLVVVDHNMHGLLELIDRAIVSVSVASSPKAPPTGSPTTPRFGRPISAAISETSRCNQ